MWQEFWEEHRKGILFAVGMVCFLAAGLVTQLLPLQKEKASASPSPVPVEGKPPTADRLSLESAVSAPETQRGGATESGAGTEDPMWFVYVTGNVRSPGVYKLPAGSRLFHLMEAAGGLNKFADPAAVNMAAPLEDGLHIHVPKKGAPLSESPAAVGPSVAASPGTRSQAGPSARSRAPSTPLKKAGGVVDVNRASQEELTSLKGIGPVLARNIVEYRQKNGPFRSVEDLLQVKGIGAKKLEGLRDSVTLGP
jgi:competence protein ComEA